MSRIFAIAGITLRNAVRSRVVLLLVTALVVATVGIPLTIKGDGTLQGQLQIMLRYSLGAAAMLLALATVWAGCAAISLEIQHRRIHLVVVKPVPRSQIWLGSWLGLIVLNAVLLAFVGLLNYALLRWRLAREATTSHERQAIETHLLVARRLLRAAPPQVEADVEEAFRRMLAEGKVAPRIPKEQYYKALRDRYRQRARSVETGGRLVWTFPSFPEPRQLTSALLRFRFAISELSFEDVQGTWRVRRESHTESFECPHEGAPQKVHVLEIPSSALKGAGGVIAEYENRHERPITVFFDPDEGVSLLVPAGGFAGNYARALGVILFHLIFLAAIGTAMGSLFSMPVASFVAWSLVFLLTVANFMENLSAQFTPFGDPVHPTTFQKVLNLGFRYFFAGFRKVVGPLRGPDPLDLLSEGILLSPEWVVRIFLIKVVLYSGLLALFSFWVFNRRELALPAT